MKDDPLYLRKLLKRCLILTILVILLGYLTLPSSHAATSPQSEAYYIPKIIQDAGFRVQAGCQSKA